MKAYWDKIKLFTQKNKKLLIVIFIIKTAIKIGILVVIFLKPKETTAQSTNSLIRSGNKSYNQQKYNNATDKYTTALSKEPNNEKAIFNQANAMYQLGEYEKAAAYFDAISKQSKSNEIRGKAYHNLGNTYYKQQEYEKSVKAYKEALKINPSDKDTKYNLMMAMSKLKNGQNNRNKNNGQQNQKDKQQQQKQQQGNNNQQQGNNNQQQQGNKQQQNNKQQEQAGQMTNEEAQRLLEALQNEEGKTQQKLQQQQGNGKKTKVVKDW